MEISQTQELQIKLQQKLSPRQILLTRLLQIPIVSLEQRIEQEIEENPALEFADDEDNMPENEMDNNLSDESLMGGLSEEGGNSTDEDAEATYEELRADAEINFDDYFSEDYESTDYLPAAAKDNDENHYRDIVHSAGESFQESLFSQLGMFELSEDDTKIAVFLVGSIDESGYLTRSCEDMKNDLLFSANINTTVEHLEEIIVTIIHKLEPAGTGARDLRECLLLQLQRLLDTKNEAVSFAYTIIENHFLEFTKKRFDHIKKVLSCSDKQFEQAMATLLKLNPKPGANFSTTGDSTYIIPDFIISINDKTQQLELALQSSTLPELRVGKAYQRLYKELQHKTAITDKDRKEALDFVKQKVTAAKWFIDALSQRDQTLYKTMEAIIKYQKEFFLSGDEMMLKPMVLKDIATQIDMDISTVSRVVRLKHALTPYGVYPLKFFFSESMMRDDGEEVSVYEIKKIIADTIAVENKKGMLTDSALCDKLNEMGYNIARRTVAKYREQLGFSVARLRK
jgi:RNA polymerase sigma-54 factor